MELKPREKAVKRNNIATFDIEARNWTDFLMLGFFDGIKYIEFFNLIDFIDYLSCHSEYKGYKIYAHNGGKYDFLFIMEKLKYSCTITDINGRIFKMRIKFKYGTVEFIDSFYSLPFSLEKLINTFISDMEFKKIPVNFENLKLNNTLKLHCKNDTQSLYYILLTFNDLLNNLGCEYKGTLAGISLDLYLRKYLKLNLPSYFHLDGYLRQGYYGGRTEVYKKYLREGYYYDFNSLYPAVMYENYFPVGSPSVYLNYKLAKSDIGFCELETEINLNLPPLPVKFNKLLLYPNGNIKGWYSLEYLKLLDRFKIPYKLGKAVIFDKQKIFKDFVSDLYGLRLKNKNNVMDVVCKLLMNSLYGKFAQNIKQKTFYLMPVKTDDKTNYSIYYDIWFNETDRKLPFQLIGLSSYVTTYAHLKLFEYINKNTFYVDTDSIFTDLKLPVSSELGALKLESEIKEAVFISQKNYSFLDTGNNQTIKFKGIPKKIYNQFDFEDYLHAVKTGDYSKFNVCYKSILGWKEGQTRLETKCKGIVHYTEKKKSIKNIDTKRQFLSINKSIPFTIDNRQYFNYINNINN